MTNKPNPLKAAMLGVQQADKPAPLPKPVEVVPVPVAPRTSTVASTRIGKRSITGHVDDDVLMQFKILATEQRRTQESMFQEMLNDLFRKYNKSAISELPVNAK